MKKLILLIIVALGVWLGINYYNTGKISLLPVELTAEEQELRDLEAELKSVEEQIAQESRSAGLTGMDSTMAVSRLMERKKKIEERIEELRAR
jgi:peptidoglycan hydrolase CwlO-like protein